MRTPGCTTGTSSSLDQPALLELRNEAIHLGRAEEEVDLGQRVDQLVLVALHHAADADDRLAASLFLETAGFDERVDRFLLGGVDEAARVHDDDVGVGHVARVLGAAIGELRDVALAIDGVLVAPERNDGDFQHG